MNVREIRKRWSDFTSTRQGERLVKGMRALFLAVIVGVLLYQVSGIGWSRVLSSLPTQPAFYLLVLAMYFVLPVTESLIYGRLWGLRPMECLGVMIRKRVLNVDVVGYSGEVYLVLWAKTRVREGTAFVVGTVKDNLIVSAASSLIAAAMLIGILLAAGQIPLADVVDVPSPFYVSLGAIAAVFLGVVVYRFRHVIFSLSRRTLAALSAAHVVRFFVGYVLQVAAWWIVIPTASFQTWAILLVLFVVINRIPFLPSSDLVFVSAGAGLTPLLDVPVAPVVSMLLVRSAADRLLNLVFFTSSVWLERHAMSTTEDEEVDARAIQQELEGVGSVDAPPDDLNS
ncbi:MAG: hypothetical protein WD021_02730 [Rhodothermales bacterium]